MHIYFSGIGGIGLSALAHMALDVGYHVSGSDLNTDSEVCEQLKNRGAQISDNQSGEFLSKQHHRQPVDWLVYSAAVPDDNPERTLTTKQLIKQTKRAAFIQYLIDKYRLQLLAVSGTHGKTTTTAMAAWALREQQPISWLIGSHVPFGHHGRLDPDSDWLVLEADEYDRMMLEFEPQLSLIPSIEYDHADIYPTKANYYQAFRDFVSQSRRSVGWLKDAQAIELGDKTNFHALEEPRLDYDELPLIGDHNRANAELVACGLELAELMKAEQALERLADFPGTSRRFERITDNLISDYAHHPTEIASTLELAREYHAQHDFNQLVVVYQPHQDERQREVKLAYEHAFDKADQIYWLPTYDPPGRHHQPHPLNPEQLIVHLAEPDNATIVALNDELLGTIDQHVNDDDLVLVMGAGSVDDFVRPHFLTKSH